MRLQEKAPVVSYALPGSSSPWRVALDPDWPSACAGTLGSACRDPGHPVCVHISAVGFIRRVGRLCSRAGVASGCRAQSSQLWGDGRPSRRRHPPRKTAASPHLRPWHPPTQPPHSGNIGPGPPPGSQAGQSGVTDGPVSSFWTHCSPGTHTHIPLARPATLTPSDHRWCGRWVPGLVAAITAVPEAGRGPAPPEISCRPLPGCGYKAETDIVLWDVSAGMAASGLRVGKQ